ncbi:MAG: HAMP domain-containing sensor histidine kinase [Bacteroidales bacterium]|nr:HAMP domain-containing histidine kinase [Bacteroidales bacterium]MDD6186174.1 HAMP domain-containing sensor histidine kinase [Bacteroidales bacterium]
MRKPTWKWILFISAAAIFTVIIIYSNKLIKKIAQEERQRIEIWAGAITYKTQIINETEKFFDSIRIEEGNQASIFAKAVKKVAEASLYEDITFYQDIISANKTVPTIIASPNGNIDAAINLPDSILAMRNIRELGEVIQDFDSLKLPYYHREYVMVYYKNSHIYGDFREMIDNLLESFFQETVINSASVPVIITDSTQINVIAAGNIDSVVINSPFKLNAKLEKMREENDPIVLDWLDHGKCYVFYEESSVLTQLRLFPFIQYGIIFVFLLIAYLLFSVTKRSEENRVWVGMSKETAHQLGTPISSLMAWTELLKEMPVDQSIPEEIGKDVHRLETIAQRFSKIGSVPVLEETDIVPVIDDFASYLQTRISSMVNIIFEKPDHPIVLPINKQLFEWVIENLCKNSADAMTGKGTITIEITEEKNKVFVDITDTGKGIPAKMQRRIFSPGYTSKSRGWGLGLTLARRIINNYHKGKLFVKSSVIDQGTTMRIQLLKNQ